jgi:hypothetical protein
MWAKDWDGGRAHILPVPAKLDPTQFRDAIGVVVDVGAAGAAGGAVAIPISPALDIPGGIGVANISSTEVLIPAGTVLDFGGAKFARLTADAKRGDVSLTVAALPTALVDADVAVYNKSGPNAKFIQSGTIVGRTYAERDANTPFGLGVDTDDELFILAFDVPDTSLNDEGELYRHHLLVAENYLPEWMTGTRLQTGGVATTLMTKIRTLYRCIKGVD